MTKDVIAERFEEVGLAADRFVKVESGEKMCVDHDSRWDDPREVPSDNYGIYADVDDQLVILDVDYHREGSEEISPVSMGALSGLPLTLKVLSPHVPDGDRGGHRIYKLEGDETPAELFDREFGKMNPVPSWGEVVAKSKYCVGPGSQLDSCTKDWCEECKEPEGGYYGIKEDREIATVDPETLVEALSVDPDLEREGDSNQNRTLDDVGESGDENGDEENRDYEDLPRETVEEMLEAIPGTQHFDDWIRTGYAVYDWDDGEEGKSVFEDWSRKNPKWEEGESQRQIDYIWDNGEDGDGKGKASVGTLVHLAKENGWQGRKSVPSYDDEEVERGVDILKAECTPEEPAGEMDHVNGHYGYWYMRTDEETGEKIREFDQVTNFTLETLEQLNTDEGDLLKLRVHPAHPMEDPYEVDVHPTVFNETRSFKEEIVRGRTTRYEPGKRSQQALNDLRETVGSQLVPKRTGVEHIGLAGDEYDEWVTPKGTLAEEGQAEDPDHRYYAKGGSSDSDGGALARKWNLDPEEFGDVDRQEVADIVELLPQTRRRDRGLPVLGWFFAAPLRPLVHDWEDEFNLLQVVGSTGTGKTSTLKVFWEALGMEPEPFSASATPFTLMKHMSSSSGIPVWIDEYKPADIRNDRLDKLHRRLREVTKGGSVSKGRANLGEVLFELKAPVVVSGEQKFSQSVPAVRRRTIMTTLSSDATVDGSEYARAFSELTGTAYEDENGVPQYPEGHDLSEHAQAYYQFILSQEKEDLHEMWKDTREKTADLLKQRGLTLERTEFQGAQTILFGVRVFRQFADLVGADEEPLPTDNEVADAFEHFASNIGNEGQRMGYDDSFLKLFSQAASAGYLEDGHDFRFMDSKKFGGEVLAFHMPSVDAAVRKYVREYNLEDEYTLVGKTDYISALKDKIDRNGSHVDAVNHSVRLENGAAKCVVIDPNRTEEVLGSGFEKRAFRDEAEKDESDEGPPAPEKMGIGEIDPSKQDRATVVGELEYQQWDGRKGESEDGPRYKVTLKDDTGTAKLQVWDDEEMPEVLNDPTGLPEAVHVKDASVGSYEGTTQLTVKEWTEVSKAQVGAGETSASDSPENQEIGATPDGGTTDGIKPRVLEAVDEYGPGQAINVVDFADGFEEDVDTVVDALENIASTSKAPPIEQEDKQKFRKL